MESSNKSAKTILFVDRAGAQSIWHLISYIRASLEKDGHDVHTCRWNDGFAIHEDNFDKGPNDHVINIPVKRTPLGVINQHLKFMRPFKLLLENIRPDILHTNFVVPGGLATLLGHQAKVPKIITTRHELETSLSPHLRFWGALCERHANHVTYVSQFAAENSGHTGATSDFTHLGNKTRHVIIRNGINISALKKTTPIDTLNDEKTIVVVGRMVPLKAQSDALKGFALAYKVDPTLRLDFVGDGPDKESLMAQVIHLGLESSVRFKGWLPRDKTLAHMKAAHIVLIPSKQEGFGLILAEAMALGVSVIANAIPVFKEVASLGEGVTFTQTNTPKTLCATILKKLPKTQISSDLDIQQMVIGYKKLYSF